MRILKKRKKEKLKVETEKQRDVVRKARKRRMEW